MEAEEEAVDCVKMLVEGHKQEFSTEVSYLSSVLKEEWLKQMQEARSGLLGSRNHMCKGMAAWEIMVCVIGYDLRMVTRE